MFTKSLILLVLGLVALARGQEAQPTLYNEQPPSRGAPGSAPPGGPPAAGPAGPMNNGGQMGSNNSDCSPPRTGREWVCRIDHWDNDEQRVVDSMEKQKCHEDDMCYLGPLMSYPFRGPWEKKWMCGPKPCKMEPTEEGDATNPGCKNPSDECGVGPFNITVDAVSYKAWYCRPSPTRNETWVPTMCSINSSKDGFLRLRDCEDGEMCARGPLDFWHNAIQLRAFFCTKPMMSREMPSEANSEEEYNIEKIHKALMEMSEELIWAGVVTHGGPEHTPHDVLHMIGQDLSQLRGHLEAKKRMNKEMMPAWQSDSESDQSLMTPVIEDVFMKATEKFQMLENMINRAPGMSKVKEVYMKASEAANKLYEILTGGKSSDPMYMLSWIQETMNEFWMLDDSELNSDKAKNMFKKVHMKMLTLTENGGFVADERGMMDMFSDMQSLWNHMTGGPTLPDTNPRTLMRRLHDGVNNLMQRMMAQDGPDGIAEKAEEAMKELYELVKDWGIRSEKARKIYMKVNDLVYSLWEYLDNGPIREQFDIAALGLVDLWNHMTNGPVMPNSRPIDAFTKIKDGIGMLRLRMYQRHQREQQQGNGAQPGNRPQPGNAPQPGNGQGNERNDLSNAMAMLRRLGNGNSGNSEDQGLVRMVENLRRLHEHFSQMRRIPEGPGGVLYQMSNDLERLMNNPNGGSRIMNAMEMVRNGLMRLAEVADRPEGANLGEIFRPIMQGLRDIVNDMNDRSGGSTALNQADRMLRDMENGGNNGQGQGGNGQQGNGQQGPNGPEQNINAMMQQIGDTERNVNDMMRNMGNNGANNQGMGERQANNMNREPQMARDSSCRRDFWQDIIPEREREMWRLGDNAFLGPHTINGMPSPVPAPAPARPPRDGPAPPPQQESQARRK